MLNLLRLIMLMMQVHSAHACVCGRKEGKMTGSRDWRIQHQCQQQCRIDNYMDAKAVCLLPPADQNHVSKIQKEIQGLLMAIDHAPKSFSNTVIKINKSVFLKT